MTKVNYLFDMSKLLQRPIPEQSKFEEENYELLKAFENATYTGFEKTLEDADGKPPLSMNFLWFPNAMNGNVVAEMGKRFPEQLRPTGRKNHKLMLKPNYECYIKKLDKALKPSYHHSMTSAAMCEQKALSRQDALPIIFIGYTMTDTNDKVTGCYAVCWKGKERVWVSDLTALQPPSTGDGYIIAPISPNTPPTPDVQVGVKVKPNKKAQ
jgi:hypothetical protein